MDETQELFTVENLTESINRTEQTPGRIGELGLFEEKRIDTTSVNIVEKNNSIILVPAKPRGSEGTSLDTSKRKGETFPLVHLPMSGAVLAESTQNVKPFGGETREDMVQAKIDEELDRMRGSIDVTIEWQRMGALKGKILDHDGEVIVDLFQKFGMTRFVKTLDFTKDLRTQLIAAKRESKKAQGAIKAPRYRCLAGPELIDELMVNDDFKRAYERYDSGSALRDDVTGGISFGGILWEEYEGQVGDQEFVLPNEGLLVPEGVRGMYRTYFGPGTYEETVNTLGLPYYAKAERMKFDKGHELEAQSNTISLTAAPRAVVGFKVGTKNA
ncbi:major capsid protein [uncultured Paraglaciecola sp.]|uniref:major capsid protein n=1 Tax=uncultured Paraglaciecola sp. TaxID=1765024 RepID=UPI0026023817|nr:major capsid protein [uncultured Paraglaciecola sp.]